MLILGCNEGSTRYGKRLKDGAVCLLDDSGVVFALAEERITREKQAPGHSAALARLQKFTGIRPEGIDLLAVSSCCEDARDSVDRLGRSELVRVPHHLSHACAAFFLSPFEEALVVVIDAGGSVLEPMATTTEWWRYAREQHSYYIGRGNSVACIGRDCSGPLQMGLGEFFRAVTHFLGWHSSQYCGNVMALSAFGQTDRAWPAAFEISSNGDIVSRIRNSPLSPVETIRRFLHEHGVAIDPREPTAPIHDSHIQAAKWAQDEIERVLFSRLGFLMNSTGVFNLCIAGGLALNCTLAGRLWANTPAQRVFVPIAPGDAGQALGNALYCRHVFRGIRERIELRSAALGGSYDIKLSFLHLLASHRRSQLRIWSGKRIGEAAAVLLAQGHIVGLFTGRSEFGPRALGFRSILADPRSRVASERLNRAVKKREPFMPYAPSILESEKDNWFFSNGDCSFMQFAFPCRPGRAAQIPAVVHRDGTARIQTVSEEYSPVLYHILKHFFTITGIPILLNTSMNLRGEPIVEMPEEAFELFDLTDIDAIIFGESAIVCRAQISPNLGPNLETIRADLVVPDGKMAGEVTIIQGTSAEDMRRLVDSNFPGYPLFFRKELGLLPEYFEWWKRGKKVTTIRFHAGMIDLPVSWELPVPITGPKNEGKGVATDEGHVASIQEVRLKCYGELNEKDATADGFGTLDELREALWRIYGYIPRTSIVSIYRIHHV